MNADYDAVALVQKELEPGESFLWVGRPAPGRSALQSLPILLFAIPWTGFAVFWVVGAASMGMPTSAPSSWQYFPLFGVPFILVGLGMLSVPYWVYRTATRTVYGISDRRILVIQARGTRSVQSYPADRIAGVRRRERSDGSGDLFVTVAAGGSGPPNPLAPNVGGATVTFYGIANVKEVDRLIRETFKPE